MTGGKRLLRWAALVIAQAHLLDRLGRRAEAADLRRTLAEAAAKRSG